MSNFIGQSFIVDILKQPLQPLTILTGVKGSGKETLVKHIVDFKKYKLFEIDIKVDSIRNVLDNISCYSDKNVYLIKNAEDMSIAANNSLLTITENSYFLGHFILLYNNKHRVIETLKSRSLYLEMAEYTNDELYYIIQSFNPKEEVPTDFIRVPGDYAYYTSLDMPSYIEFIEKFKKNIQKVDGANALKLATYFNIKKDDDKYDFYRFLLDLQLFYCMDNDNIKSNINFIYVICKYLNMLSFNNTLNILPIIDSFIINMRKVRN